MDEEEDVGPHVVLEPHVVIKALKQRFSRDSQSPKATEYSVTVKAPGTNSTSYCVMVKAVETKSSLSRDMS